MCYHLISETTIFHYPNELLMDKSGCERSEIKRFCCKNISLRRYGSFNGFFELYYLELLMSTGKLQQTNNAISLSNSLILFVPAL